MAKYSRSALSMRESLAEINDQKAEKFLNTFYFQYGHRSIADLAHIAFAIERLSILAATIAVDEPRWDGQERSTRYQDFQRSGYYVPRFSGDARSDSYRETVDHLFAEYRHLSEEMFRHLRERTPKPDEMKQDATSAPCAPAPSTSRDTCCRWRRTLRWVRLSAHARWRTRSRACCPTPTPRCATWASCCGGLHRNRRTTSATPRHVSCWKRSRDDASGAQRRAERILAARGARRSHADEICRAEFLRNRHSA